MIVIAPHFGLQRNPRCHLSCMRAQVVHHLEFELRQRYAATVEYQFVGINVEKLYGLDAQLRGDQSSQPAID